MLIKLANQYNPENRKNNHQKRNNNGDKPYQNNKPRENKPRDIYMQDATPNKSSGMSPDVKAAIGGAAIIGGTALAIRGGGGTKYLGSAGEKAFEGAQRYITKAGNPFTRLLTRTGFKTIKNLKQAQKNEKPNQSFTNIIQREERKDNVNHDWIKTRAVETLDMARKRNQVEKKFGGSFGGKPRFENTDINVHLKRAEQEFLNGAADVKNNVAQAKPKFGKEVAQNFGAGIAFAGGVSAIHAIEDSLSNKKDNEAKKRREEAFRSVGSML